MAELSEGLSGYLDVENATLRAPRIEATSNIGIANTNPQHAFSVGSNLYIDTESSDVLIVKGNVVTEGIKMGFLEITPSYDFAAVSNVGNITSNTIIFDNPIQGFVATGNATIGSTLTVTGFRITAAAAAQDDLEAITTDDPGADPPKVDAGRTPNAIHITNATESTTPYTGALQIGTNTGANGGLGVAGNVHVNQGVYTQDLSVSGEIVSNLAVNTDDLFVDIVNSRVGIGKTEPTVALDVVGAVNASGNVAVDTNTLFVDSVNNKVGVGTTEPGATLEVTGNAYVSSNLEVGTANLFVDTVNSRVGIGTDAPDTMLEVAGNAKISSVYRETFTVSSVSTGTYVYLGRFSTQANAIVEIASAGDSQFNSNKFEFQRQFSATPHVSGIDSDHYLRHRFFFKSVDTLEYDIWHQRDGTSWSTPAGNMTYRIQSHIYSKPSDPGSAGSIECRYSLYITNEPGSVNVGIGTYAPGNTLDVNGGISTAGITSTGGFVTTTGIQISMAYNTWYNVVDYRSYRYAWKRMFIAGYRYGYNLTGNATFFVSTDTGGWAATSSQEFNYGGIAFQVSGNYIQAKQTWYLGNTESLIFRIVSLT